MLTKNWASIGLSCLLQQYILGMWLQCSLQWSHNECDGVWNRRRHDCSLNRLFRRRSKKTSKLRVTCLCEGNLPVTEVQWRGKCFHLMTSSCHPLSHTGCPDIGWKHIIIQTKFNIWLYKLCPANSSSVRVDTRSPLGYPCGRSRRGAGHSLH